MGTSAWTYLFVAALASVSAEPNYLSDEFIGLINSKQTTWKAGRNFASDTPIEYLKILMGTLPKPTQLKQLLKVEQRIDLIDSLPENFDPREKWPNCPTLNDIRDQGACGSCWAFGAVSAMTDRVCTYSNGSKQFYFSAVDLISCCSSCGSGCHGGDPNSAWKYWVSQGIVSGGGYNSSQGCQPYVFSPCEHRIPGPKEQCEDYQPTPKCLNVCEDNYKVDYKDDKHYGVSSYNIKGEDYIKAELFKNGPVEAGMMVYDDFIHYKSGVYQHVEGSALGGHAVKILGWGVENGTKYWLVANSWNPNWGDNGFFKILRGENHCGIEDYIVAGEPF